MFLHIGNNVLLRKDEVIGIFSIESLEKDSKGRKFMNEVRKANQYEDISDGKWSSLIMTNTGMYISRISSTTLLGRSGADMKEMLAGIEPAKKSGKKAGGSKPDIQADVMLPGDVEEV